MVEPVPTYLRQPAQQERTVVTEASEVITPWRIWVRSSVAAGVLTWLTTLGILLLWAYVGAMVAERASPWRGFWWAAWQGVRSALRHFKYWAVLPALAQIGWWWYYGRIMLHYRYVPEQMNRNYPYVFNAQDPQEATALTFWDALRQARERARREQAETDEEMERHEASLLPVRIEQNGGRWLQDGVPLPEAGGADALASFLRAVMNRTHNFSRPGAMSCSYKRREWEELEAWCLQRGYAEKGQGLTAAGKREFALSLLKRFRPAVYPRGDGE